MKTTRIVKAFIFGALLATTPTAALAEETKQKKNKGITLTEIGRYEAGPSTVQPVIATPSGNRRLRPRHKTALRNQRGSGPY